MTINDFRSTAAEEITIDTYQMFDGESTLDGIDYYSEEERDNIDFDMVKVTQGLADAACDFIKENDVHGIINRLNNIKAYSPKEYNYSTDYFICDIDINDSKLFELYKNSNIQDFKIIRDNLYSTTITTALVSQYINDMIKKSVDGYIMHMHDIADQLYYENMTINK